MRDLLRRALRKLKKWMPSRRRKAAGYFDLGVAAMGRYDLPAAKEAMQRCVELAPGDPDAWVYLGMALMPREPEAAAQALDRALALDANNFGALYHRAEAHWFLGDPSSAARLLRRLNDLAPDVSHNLGRLALAHLDAGEVAAANAAFREAIEAGGGLAAVAKSQPELRRAIYLDLSGRHDEARRLIEGVNAAGPADYPAARYPRALADQANDLERVVAGRSIVVLGSGPSLAQLQPLLEKLGPERSRQLCFFGFNNVPVAERLLKDAIGRRVDLACVTSTAVMELHAAWIESFLATPGVFLTLTDMLVPGRPTAEMIRAQLQKTFIFAASGDYPPIPQDPLHFPPVNTLMCVLPLAVLARPKNIFLFGCDGVAPLKGGGVYFRQGSEEYGKQNVASEQYARWLARDTFFFNAMISTVLDSLSVLHRIALPPIYLCNPDSAYRPFPRIDGDEFLRIIA